MTPKEALENIKQHMKTYHRHPVDEELNEEIEIIEQYLNELEELKKNVARFLEVIPKPVYRPLHDEAYNLYTKLSKVGKQDE